MAMRLSFLGGLILLATSGCGLVTTIRGPMHDRCRPLHRHALSGLLDLKGVLHCHSHLSHDSEGTVDEISEAAAAAGLDFLVMTDHQTAESVADGVRGFVNGTLFMVGAEIRTPGGTLLAFPLQSEISAHGNIAGYIEAIHDQGGLAMIGHAERFLAWDEPTLDGVEVVNLHAQADAAGRLELLTRLLLTPLRLAFASLCGYQQQVLSGLDEHLDGGDWPFPVIGGNDAHANIRLLGSLGWVIGTYEELFACLSTHVLAEGLDQDAIVDAVRRGRTYVVYDLRGEGTGFDFHGHHAGELVLMGGTVVAGADTILSVDVPSMAQVRLLRDGEIVAQRTGTELRFRDPEPGIYRVEVWKSGRWPWIFSSAIRVTAR